MTETTGPSTPASNDYPIYVSQTELRGGEECWSCGVTPGTEPTSVLKSTLFTASDPSEDKQIELCEDCSAEIFRYFVISHLEFMKDKEKFKEWIFAGSPFFAP